MLFPRVIPHSDGAGVIESVGRDVDPARIGRRVWVYGAQSYRPSGTAAQLTIVPDRQAVDLPGSPGPMPSQVELARAAQRRWRWPSRTSPRGRAPM